MLAMRVTPSTRHNLQQKTAENSAAVPSGFSVLRRSAGAPQKRSQVLKRSHVAGQRLACFAFDVSSTPTRHDRNGSQTGHSLSVSSVDGPLQSISAEGENPLAVSWAGSGLYFWWQLGAVKYLAKNFDLRKVRMVGASGGALAAVLATCNIDADRAFDLAYEMAEHHGIWNRPAGLFGVWGGLIRQWLREILPPNAAELCRGNVGIVVTTLPKIHQKAIDDFNDKEDLISCLMASIHIPFILDWKPTYKCRGMFCVDGSFPDFFYNDNSTHLKCGGSAVIFDYFDDAQIPRNGRMDMLKLRTHDELHEIMDLGYQYAAMLHKDGRFVHFRRASESSPSAALNIK